MKKEKAVDILTRAKERITPKEKWLQCHYAGDSEGHPLTTCDEEAQCWCAVGTLLEEMKIPVYFEEDLYEGHVSEELYHDFNELYTLLTLSAREEWKILEEKEKENHLKGFTERQYLESINDGQYLASTLADPHTTVLALYERTIQNVISS